MLPNSSVSNFKYKLPHFRIAGYLIWVVFALLSIVFYKERAAFMDGAFQLVNLINTGEFSTHHFRITNPLTQILAWLAVKFNMPLNYVMMGYSLNFVLFHIVIYHLIVNWCGNDRMGLVQIGFFTLFSTQTFYFLTPEFYQGMSILCLWTAIFLQNKFDQTKWKLPLLCALLVPIIFDHALLSLFCFFIMIFLWLHDKNNRSKQFYALVVVLVLIYVIHDMYFIDWYDEARRGYFWKHWNQYYPNFETIPGNKIFFKKCLNIYYLFPMLIVAISSFYIYKRIVRDERVNFSILKLLLVIGFCFFYLLVNHINDPKTEYLFYSEVNYLGLAIPLMMAIAFDILPNVGKQRIAFYLIAFILLSRVITIIGVSETLESRHAWMLSTIDQTNSKKVYLPRSKSPTQKLIQVWSIPEETLLLTSLENPENSSSLLVNRSDYKYIDKVDSTHYFLRTHSAQLIEDLNFRYFKLGNGWYKEADMSANAK